MSFQIISALNYLELEYLGKSYMHTVGDVQPTVYIMGALLGMSW
jgi:hypothetical protein